MRTNPARESDDQKALAYVLDNIRVNDRPLLWCHVPNEGKRNPAYAAELKRRGVKAGVPDVLIFDRPPKFPEWKGAAIELKRKGRGKVQESQNEWLDWLTQRGWITQVCYGVDDAVRALEQLGYKGVG